MQLERILEETLAKNPNGAALLEDEVEWENWLENAIDKTSEYATLALEGFDACCTLFK